MSNELRYDGRVAIITGAGNGLGRAHALLFASRGAKVVVNDLGGSTRGDGSSSAAADKVVEEIRAAGGEAVANYDSVEDGAKIVQTAIDAFGRVDIVVNNAGILRDVSFHKMTDGDWDIIQRVHVNGAFKVTHAAWPKMRDQGYGRIIFTASAAGIYGNFGQANYSAAKLALVGFSNTLALEGRKYNVRANTIAPIAGSRMTETILPKELIDALRPEYVSPLVAWLSHESCEDTGGLYEVGGGFFSKLRWERTQGHTVRLGRAITPELVKSKWSTIVDFAKATHPADVAAALSPVMDNVNAGASKGGNEFVDVDQALGYEMPKVTTEYDERDLSMYALGVGAAADPLDDTELRYVYEMHGKGFWPLPTFAVIPAQTGIMQAFKDGHTAPGFNFGLDRLLHGEQYTELKRPLPPHAKLTHRTWVKDIFDKGKNAFIVFATESSDESGEVIAYNELGAVIRGAGGWGGDRGPSGDSNTPPDRKPDAVAEEQIRPNQALLYRLSGDWNPLHVDPAFAGAFGFPKPILHGLCTLGVAARHVIKHFAAGDPRKFKSIKVRFSESVFPGETLVTEMWKESDNRVILRCRLKERDKVVLSQAAIEFYSEIPQPKPKAKPAAAAASASAEVTPTSADVFTAIDQFLGKNPDLAKKAGVVFQFKLKDPESVWTLDLKNGKLAAGEAATPECTLELTDADFMDMCSGKADPQKLYMGGKMKIGGNLMASTKLNFLTKLDPATVMAAARARAGAGGGGAAAAAPEAPQAPTSADYMAAIGEFVKGNAELPGKVATVFQFRLKNPDSAYVFDLKSNPGKVYAGEVEGAGCTLELSDSDFILMTTGKADPQKLFGEGKLKIGGDLMASMKLGFLKKIDMSKVKAGSAPKAAAPAAAAAAPRAAQAPAVLDQAAAKLAALKSAQEATIELRVKSPDAVFFLQVGPQGGKLVDKAAGPATTTVTVADEDLAALAQGKAKLATLYQRGKLRVDGDVAAAHLLAALEQSN
ncbi:SDR family NAD(P)-dependent oxidoreductase [Nannocystis pusilla]|uniref:peroxisomal multifunctional enzyme type 2 n=1 Tax=Nannocystis pusilla TaxID=889268 RepID=UPI003DA68318